MNRSLKIIFIVACIIFLMSCSTVDRRLKKLTILEENYPCAFFFRAGKCDYFFWPGKHTYKYSTWEQNFERLMGIQGKCLDEETIKEGANSLEFFNRFKKNHPNQVVLLHFDGMARDPYFQSAQGEFFAGHWLYHNGARILSDVSDESGITSIHVSDASLFMVDIGIRNRDANDDIGLCELDDSGKPNWAKSEQVRLVSVDIKTNTIQVERGCYGTEPRAFSAGSSYAAAHCTAGPWGENLLWFYNYSAACPKDASGNNCIDILLDDLSQRFSTEGELFYFDGIEFDILLFDLETGMLNPRRVNTNRGPDADADGKADNGVIDGINTYGIGTNEFLKRLRNRLGNDRLITADGGYPYHQQRGFGILNGIESEGWPTGRDYNIEDWSGGMNRHLFWYQNSRAPKMNYINHRYSYKFDYSKVDAHQVRLVIAASVLTNSAYAFAALPPYVLGYEPETPDDLGGYRWSHVSEYPIWDELVMGEANKVGWLGKPVCPPVSMAEKETPILIATNGSQFRYLMDNLKGTVQFKVDGEALRVTTANSYVGNLAFTLQDVSSYSPDLTVLVTVRGEDMEDYPENIARLIHVSLPRSTEGMDRFMSWFNEKDFQSRFYFSHTPFVVGSPDIPVEVDLEFEFESTEPVWISEVRVYNHPDAMVREFEHGVVLANPSPRPYTFNLAELFPGKKFRRIKGSPKQDPETNDGSLVTENTIRLKGKDALFLIKE